MRPPTGIHALALGALLVLAAATPVGAQEPPGDDVACLLTLDEMSAAVGRPFSSMVAAGEECAYATDPAVDLLSVWIGVIPTEPVEPGGPDALWFIRFEHEAGGRAATVAGLPAWVSDDGVWVDAGHHVIEVWPLFLFDDDPPPVADSALAIAELAAPRAINLPAASPAPSAAIIAWRASTEMTTS
jgi:hypothetical protein